MPKCGTYAPPARMNTKSSLNHFQTFHADSFASG
jgi:hypothetical protein